MIPAVEVLNGVTFVTWKVLHSQILQRNGILYIVKWYDSFLTSTTQVYETCSGEENYPHIKPHNRCPASFPSGYDKRGPECKGNSVVMPDESNRISRPISERVETEGAEFPHFRRRNSEKNWGKICLLAFSRKFPRQSENWSQLSPNSSPKCYNFVGEFIPSLYLWHFRAFYSVPCLLPIAIFLEHIVNILYQWLYKLLLLNMVVVLTV